MSDDGHHRRGSDGEDPQAPHRIVLPLAADPRRRIDVALHAVVIQPWIEGVCAQIRDTSLLLMPRSRGATRSSTLRVARRRGRSLAVRPLDEQAFRYVFLDATYGKARGNGRVVSRAVVIATGVSADGRREVLGVDVGDSETEVFRADFLRELRDRGLSGVQQVISDHTAA